MIEEKRVYCMEHKTYDQLIEELQETVSYISDMDTHEMLHMSPSAMEQFGIRAPEEYRDRKCYQLLHGVDRPCTFCTNGKVAAERSVAWVQYNQRLKKWMLVNDHLKELDGRKCRVEIMDEITQAQHWRRDLTEHLNMETVLLQCIQTLSGNRSLHFAVSAFLEMVSRFYCADRAYIFEFDLEKQTLSNTFEWCAEGVSRQIEYLQNIPLAVVTDWVDKFRRDGEFFTTSIQDDLDPESTDYKLLAQQQIDSLMAAPLYLNGQITGFLGVDNPEANLDNITLLRATSDFVAVEVDKRRMLEQLEYLSYTDTLTGVSNRNKYISDLNARYWNVPRKLGVILVDINGLSGVNNSLGHQYGDSVITKTAKLLKETLPWEIYRIGGDEFIVPCPEVEKEAFAALVEKVRSVFRANPDCDVSIGTSWKCVDIDIDAQILQADEQMQAEKQSYYHDAYTHQRQIGGNPAADVLEEIAAGRFKVHYQPKVDLRTRKIVGVEALVRKTDEDGRLIPPGQFVPQYEARNVMMHVDIHVLDTALATVRDLQDGGHRLYMSVNFSRATLMMPDFVPTVLSMCARHGVSPSSIMLEVTETISTIGRERLRDLLREIRQAGLCLSLDDFGSKYSNTAILADIEFDEIKLDKTLVDDICQNTRSRTILKNLMGMCRELENTQVVAEGIETADQAAVLEQFDCDWGQGFHFYRPMPLEQLTAILEGVSDETE